MTPDPVVAPRVGGAFSLTDHHGYRVTDARYRGRFLLVFFGFSHCREVCPRVLAKLTSVMDRLGEDAHRLQPLYVTVDPERDSPEVLKAYLGGFHPSFVGLTGTPEEIDTIKTKYRVFAHRAAQGNAPDAYDVPHTSLTYLIGPDGEYRTHFSDAIDEEMLTSRLRDELRDARHPHEVAEGHGAGGVEPRAACH